MSAWYSTTVHHVHGPHTASELKRIGIRGLVRRRPIVFSSRTVMLPVMAILATSGFGAVVLAGWTAAFRPWDTHALLMLPLAMMLLR